MIGGFSRDFKFVNIVVFFNPFDSIVCNTLPIGLKQDKSIAEALDNHSTARANLEPHHSIAKLDRKEAGNRDSNDVVAANCAVRGRLLETHRADRSLEKALIAVEKEIKAH